MDRMTPERHAEIVEADRRAEIERGFIAGPTSPVFHRRELLLELAEVARELAELEDLGTEAYADKLMEKARMRNLEIRGGHFELDLTQVEELASAYVAFARTLLGDAENYSETPVDFHVKIAEESEKYILTVQRTGPWKLTPHQARQRAEAERDTALARVAELEAELGETGAAQDRKVRLLKRLEEQRDEQRARATTAEESLKHVTAAVTAELPPVDHVRRRLATNPLGGEQNYLELAEAIWHAVGAWPDAESEG